MMLRALTAAAALSFTLAGVALADPRLTAALETPVAAKTRVVAGGAVWTCEGNTCSASAASTRSLSFRACQDLAKEVGRVSTYGGRTALDAGALGKCNVSARAFPTTQTAAK